MEQQCTVDAVMADENDRVVSMSRKDEPQCVCGTRDEILKRVSIRKAHQVGRRKPCGKNFRVGLSHFFETLELPRAIVDVVECVEDAGIDIAGLGNRGARRNASLQRASIDDARPPARRDALGNSFCLGSSARGQREVGATAKPLRLDAFDMPMTRKENLCPR